MEPAAATMGGAAYPERGADSTLTDSFIGTSRAHTTNVAVAPGIAEAATALGLVAAIPAVMIYNVLARSTAITAR
jgi:biopolymer transport protein ExbB/TolQ